MRIVVGWCVGVLVLAGAAGCASDEKAKPRATPKPVPNVTITSVGVDGWPAGKAAISPPKSTKPPAGYSAADVSKLVSMLVTSARTAAADPTIYHSSAPISRVLKPIPAPTSRKLNTAFHKIVSPNVALATVFGKDVEVVGEPRIKSVWKIKTKKVDGEKRRRLSVKLSAYAVYEVSGTTPGHRVIGMGRTYELRSWGKTDSNYGVSWNANYVGAQLCDLAVHDYLTPEPDAKKNAKSIAGYVKTAKINQNYVEPDAPVVDFDFKKTCLAQTGESTAPAAD